MRRTAIILSDISGHLTETDKKLMKHGISIREGRIPPDVVLILNGDLVHRGPESHELLEKVDTIIEQDNVVVTLGNHDAYYLGKAGFAWDEEVTNAKELYTRWWDTGLMSTGCGLRTPYGDYLITHAGLSHQFWTHMQQPQKLEQVLQTFDNCVNDGSFFNPGEMMGESSQCPGPIWCSSRELLGGWNRSSENHELAPFHQIFGHSSPYDWDWKRWWLHSNDLRSRTTLLPKQRHSISIIGGKMFIGTDPGHGTKTASTWEPLVIPESRLIHSSTIKKPEPNLTKS